MNGEPTMKSESVDVDAWLRRAAAAEPVPELPPPGRLWWKARIVRRLREEETRIERATRPAVWGAGIGGAILLAAMGAAVALGLGRLLTAFERLPIDVPAAWAPIAVAVFVLPLAALAGVAYLAWREAG